MQGFDSGQNSRKCGRPRGVNVDGRDRLLDAAIGLFAECGIANTTVAQIAGAAQVTSAIVHY